MLKSRNISVSKDDSKILHALRLICSGYTIFASYNNSNGLATR